MLRLATHATVYLSSAENYHGGQGHPYSMLFKQESALDSRICLLRNVPINDRQVDTSTLATCAIGLRLKVTLDLTRSLVEEAISRGWVWKFDGDLSQAVFPTGVAIAKLGVATSDTRPPQLVIDNSFFLSEPVAFRQVYGLESYSRTSGESNHHRQSVSDTRAAIPTEPRGRLACC